MKQGLHILSIALSVLSVLAALYKINQPTVADPDFIELNKKVAENMPLIIFITDTNNLVMNSQDFHPKELDKRLQAAYKPGKKVMIWNRISKEEAEPVRQKIIALLELRGIPYSESDVVFKTHADSTQDQDELKR